MSTVAGPVAVRSGMRTSICTVPSGPAVPEPSTVSRAVQRDGDPLAREEAGPDQRHGAAGADGPGRGRGRSRSAATDGPGSPAPAGSGRRRGRRTGGRGGGVLLRRRRRARHAGRRRGGRGCLDPGRGRDGVAVLLRGPGEAVGLQLVDEGDAGAVAGLVLEPAVDGLAPGDVVGPERDGVAGLRASPRPRPPAAASWRAGRSTATCRRRPRRRARRACSWGRG